LAAFHPVNRRDIGYHGIGPASARSFHGEFPDVGDASTSRRVDLADTQLTDRPETLSAERRLGEMMAETYIPLVNSPAADILRNFDLL
jgi:hypothetical protein